MILYYILITVTKVFCRSYTGGINADIFFADRKSVVYSKSDHSQIFLT